MWCPNSRCGTKNMCLDPMASSFLWFYAYFTIQWVLYKMEGIQSFCLSWRPTLTLMTSLPKNFHRRLTFTTRYFNGSFTMTTHYITQKAPRSAMMGERGLMRTWLIWKLNKPGHFFQWDIWSYIKYCWSLTLPSWWRMIALVRSIWGNLEQNKLSHYLTNKIPDVWA